MSDTVLENRTTFLEEMMVRLTGNIDRLSLKVDALTENARRSDKRLNRLAKNARRSDRRLDRLSKKVDRTTENIERFSKEMRDEHRQFREERKAEQKEWNKKWEQLRSERIAEQKEWDKRWEQSREEWDKRWKQSREEWDKRWEQLSKDRGSEKKEWDQLWGKLSNKWGTMVEDLVGPSLPRLLREVAPCSPEDEPKVEIRAERDHPTEKGKRFEMDGVVDCGKYALFCECKSTPGLADITKLIRKLGQAREYFPEYADYHLLGGIAALHLESDLLQYASDKGILAFAVGEELMDVQNEPGFTPKHF